MQIALAASPGPAGLTSTAAGRRGGAAPPFSAQIRGPNQPTPRALPAAVRSRLVLRVSARAAAGGGGGASSGGGGGGGPAPAPPLPPVVNWHLEARCNYSCTYCFATFEDVKQAVAASRQQAQQATCGAPGGEPASAGLAPTREQLLAVPALLAAQGASRISFVGEAPPPACWPGVGLRAGV